MYSDEDLLALSGLQHLAFCERQWALIHVEQTWEDSADTLGGDYFHDRVDAVGYSCADGVRAERRVRLASRRLGLYGVADIVEVHSDGELVPVEYKVGRPKTEDWDRIQLTAQAMCLEEMHDTSIPLGVLYYGKTRRRVSVDLTSDLRDRVESLAVRMHELFRSGTTPRAPKQARCRRCSLVDVCAPEATRKNAREYWKLFEIVLEADR